MRGISIALFPASWALGPWDLPHKWLFAVGPLRFVFHKNVQGSYGENYPRVASRDHFA